MQLEFPQPVIRTGSEVIGTARRNWAYARDDFWLYRVAIDPQLIEGWWQKHAAVHLQQFYYDMRAGKRPKLVLQAPPQHGKSRMVTDFISWVAGKDPDLNTIFTSYSDELGTTANLRFQRILDSEVYPLIWANTRLAAHEDARWQRNTSVCEYVHCKGMFRVTTVNGQITGHGLDLGVVDDPIKGRAEASSKTIRDKTWNWLVDDFFSRFADHAGLLMIMTRWHVDDPVGRWIGRFPETKVLRYRAVAPNARDWSVKAGKRKVGEALFPELKPIEFLEERRKLSTSASWASLYQQSPVVTGGGVFPIERFRIIHTIDRNEIKKSVRYVDKAGTEDGGMFTAFVLMHMMRDDTYIIEDVRRGQWSALERERRLLQTARSDHEFCNPYSVYIEQEPGSGGKESAEASVRMLKGFRAYADKVTGHKEIRAEPYAAQVQGGNVSLMAGAWNTDFLDEHEVWPNGPYKDQVDASAGAFNNLAKASTYDSSYRGWD